ncbi:MAG: hypothetical protein GY803_10255 [Chloroflexi bacterium]|nr:hypothetical protein [Chloroflexota bacterium]
MTITLTDIPPDYLAVLEEQYAIATRGAATDNDILSILGALITDTRAGMVWDETGGQQHIVVDQAAYWDQEQITAEAGLDGLSTNEPGKGMQIASGLFFVAILLFAIYYFAFGRNATPASETPVDDTVMAVSDGEDVVVETDLLALGDELGGYIKIGQPATLEILLPDGRAGQTLSVVNAPIEDRQMPILDAMRDNELVTEWVAGTTVNQVYGIPPTWMNQAGVNSRILVRTDTGAVYSFVCVQELSATGQQTELFAQDRPGVTLFPLPAPTATIPILWCPYDPEGESAAIAGGLSSSVGQHVEAGNVRLIVDEWFINHSSNGQLNLDVYGRIQSTTDYGSVVISLNTPGGKYSPQGEQYQAAPQEAPWLAQFALPPIVENVPLQLEMRSPLGGVALVDLGRILNLQEFVEVDVSDVAWDVSAQEIEVTVILANTHTNSSVLITNDNFLAHQGGDDSPIRVTEPNMPYLLAAGERAAFTVILSPRTSNNVTLSILDTLWEIRGVPNF